MLTLNWASLEQDGFIYWVMMAYIFIGFVGVFIWQLIKDKYK